MKGTHRATLPEQISAIVRGYAYWSRAERRILDSITEQCITYCADGEGNPFIAQFCSRVVIPALR